MWRLQPKNHALAHNSKFKKLVAYSLFGHIFLLFCLLFILAEGPVQITVNNTQGAKIVCVPAFILTGLQQKRPSACVKTTADKSPTPFGRRSTFAHTERFDKAQHKLRREWSRPVRRSLGVDGSMKRVASIEEPKPAPQKHQSHLSTMLFQHATKKKRQFSTAAMAPKQIVKEELAQTKPEIIKQEEKPSEMIQQEEFTEGLEDVIYVDKETYASLQIAQELQRAIAEQWAPPAGVPSHISCDVQIALTALGKVQQIVMLKKSGIAAYDMAARTALLKTVYPKMVWGRTVVVHFDEEFTCGT